MSRFVILNYVVESESRFSGRETTVPIEVAVDEVRYFHPRKYGRAGTRLSFKNGSGLVVSDPFAAVQFAFDTGRANHDVTPQPVRQIESQVTGQLDPDELTNRDEPTADGLGEDQ